MSNKILMIVNEFPPVAESGVQRPLKFLKYLVKDGWEAFIVTPRNLPKQTTDDTLMEEVPQSARVFRTASLGIMAKTEAHLTELRSDFTRGEKKLSRYIWPVVKLFNDALFPIDKQIGWVPFALAKAIWLINKYKIRNVYITAFPYSSFLCGIILKFLYGNKIFWIADYRDAWQFAPMLQKNLLPFRYRFICRTDENVLRKADYVLFTSPFVLDQYTSKYPWLRGKSEVITNGYDEDDFKGVEAKSFDKFTILYMGKIYTNKRNPIPFLEALNQYMQEDFQFIHIGTIGKQILSRINKLGFNFYKYSGYKSHTEAISYSAGADINIMINNNDPDSEGVVPGKLFELLRLGKPVMAIGPHQAFIRELLARTKTGVCADAEDVEDIVRALKQLLSADYKSTLQMDEIEQFSRDSLTKRLEDIYLQNQ
jgi:glycosyltransferase involved in cell wall biosynthesis